MYKLGCLGLGICFAVVKIQKGLPLSEGVRWGRGAWGLGVQVRVDIALRVQGPK